MDLLDLPLENMTHSNHHYDRDAQLLEDAKYEAKKKCLIDVYTKIYKTRPFRELAAGEDILDDLRNDNMKTFYMITINPDPKKLTTSLKLTFVEDCKSVLKRAFVYSGGYLGFEYRKYDKRSGTASGLHAHIYAPIAKYRSPSNIAHGLYRGVFKKYCGSPQAIDVKTHNRLSESTGKYYIFKSRFTDKQTEFDYYRSVQSKSKFGKIKILKMDKCLIDDTLSTLTREMTESTVTLANIGEDINDEKDLLV